MVQLLSTVNLTMVIYQFVMSITRAHNDFVQLYTSSRKGDTIYIEENLVYLVLCVINCLSFSVELQGVVM